MQSYTPVGSYGPIEEIRLIIYIRGQRGPQPSCADSADCRQSEEEKAAGKRGRWGLENRARRSSQIIEGRCVRNCKQERRNAGAANCQTTTTGYCSGRMPTTKHAEMGRQKILRQIHGGRQLNSKHPTCCGRALESPRAAISHSSGRRWADLDSCLLWVPRQADPGKQYSIYSSLSRYSTYLLPLTRESMSRLPMRVVVQGPRTRRPSEPPRCGED
jgi:hypothetical protein